MRLLLLVIVLCPAVVTASEVDRFLSSLERDRLHILFVGVDDDPDFSELDGDIYEQKIEDRIQQLKQMPQPNYYSSVTHFNDRGDVLCMIVGKPFDSLTLYAIDIIAHEVSHCYISSNARQFREMRRAGVKISTFQQLDRGEGDKDYSLHVQEVMADIGAMIILYAQDQYTLEQKQGYMDRLLKRRARVTPGLTHYTGHYLRQLQNKPEILSHAESQFWHDPVRTMFTLGMMMGADYSMTYTAYQSLLDRFQGHVQ